MRVILDLDRPDTGTALVKGRPYRSLEHPLRRIGSLLDAGALQPGRSVRNHLRWLACSQDLPARRVGEVLELTGLSAVAGRRAGGYFLGMVLGLGVTTVVRDSAAAIGIVLGLLYLSRSSRPWSATRPSSDACSRSVQCLQA